MSTDTMYINSSRLLPTRSKNKTSNAMFPRSNSNTSIKNSSNKNNNNNNKSSKHGNRSNDKKHSQRANNNSSNSNSKTSSSDLSPSSEKSKKPDSLRIPLPQTLPNGDKPNFGSSNSNLNSNAKRRNSHNGKDKSTKDLTKNLKNLLLDNKNNKNNNNNNKKSSNKRSYSKSPKQSHKNVTNNNINNNSIAVSSLKNQNTTPIMTFLTSPINGPGSIPNMNLSEQNISSSSNSSSGTGNTPTPTVQQMPRVGSQILTRPGINMGCFNPNNNPGPPQSGQQQQHPQGFLQQPQRLQSQPQIQHQFQQQQPQPHYGLPMGAGIQPIQNMPSNIQQQQMPIGNINAGGPVSQHFQSLGYPFALNNNYRLSSVDGPLMPQQIQLMTPMFNQPNGGQPNGGQPHLQNNSNNINMNIQQRQNTMSPNVTPLSIQSTQISPKPQQTNRVQPLSSSSSNSSAKRNKSRTTSHTFAGASFATDVPQESNLPKPSFL